MVFQIVRPYIDFFFLKKFKPVLVNIGASNYFNDT
jgi:hypothetical protein